MLKKMLQKIDKTLLCSLSAILLILLPILGDIIGLHTKIEFWILEITIIISFIIIVIIYSIFSVLKDETFVEEIKVFKVEFNESINMVYLKPNSNLNLNDIVSIYVDDNGIEKFVSLGTIFNVQKTNGIIQVDILEHPYNEELLELCKNYKNIVVKKDINYQQLQDLLKYLKEEMIDDE